MKRYLIYQGIPLVLLLLPFVWVGMVGNDTMLEKEHGITENLTVILLIVAVGFLVAAYRAAGRFAAPKTLRPWIILLIMGATYFALEEISYGQHYFGWETSDGWKDLNKQDETNLHNVHSIFDKLPRALLTLGILIGGVIMPLVRRFRKIELPESDRLYWQWPTIDCLTVGLVVLLYRPVMSQLDLDFIHIGETKELFFAAFIMIYSISLTSRIRAKSNP